MNADGFFVARLLLAFGERVSRSKAFTRLRRASLLKQGFHSPLASESFGARLSLAFSERVFRSKAFTRLRRASHFPLLAQRKGNQRKGHPDIRADRASPARCPAVLAGHRPANNSAIPGLRQFAFPRCPAALLGASAGDPTSTARLRRGESQRNPTVRPEVTKDNSAHFPIALLRRLHVGKSGPLQPFGQLTLQTSALLQIFPRFEGEAKACARSIRCFLPLRRGGRCRRRKRARDEVALLLAFHHRRKSAPFSPAGQLPPLRRGSDGWRRPNPCARSACCRSGPPSPAVAPRSGVVQRGKANCLRPGMAELFAGRWTTSTAGNRTNEVRPARMPGCPSLWLPFSWASKRK